MSLKMLLLDCVTETRVRMHASAIIFLIYLLMLLVMQVSCGNTTGRPDPLHLRSLLSSGNDAALRARSFSITQRNGRPEFSRLERTAGAQAESHGEVSTSQADPVSPLGQLVTAYYMQTKIGTPPREVLLLVDTASELTWVQGASCRNCSPTKVPPFNPGLSSSFISESCTSSVCRGGKNSGFQSACNKSTGSCNFQVAYLDGSEAYGVIAREVFSLQSWDGTGSKMGNIIFGCASKDIQRPIDFSSGTLGLNRGSFSFPAQLRSRGKKNALSNKFSYCFPNRAEHLNSSGVIIFGDLGIPEHHFQYLPLKQEPPLASIIDFYYVDLQGISVGGELLDIPSSAFMIDKLGNGGTYFDSGTTVSFLVEPAHTALIQAFGSRMSHLNRTSGSDFTSELCYDVAAPAATGSAMLPRAPLVTLHFKNSVDMELREASLWVPLARTTQVVTICLAFVNAGPVSKGGVNVVGNYQQQDYLIEHDLESSRIGFAPANCVVD